MDTFEEQLKIANEKSQIKLDLAKFLHEHNLYLRTLYQEVNGTGKFYIAIFKKTSEGDIEIFSTINQLDGCTLSEVDLM